MTINQIHAVINILINNVTAVECNTAKVIVGWILWSLKHANHVRSSIHQTWDLSMAFCFKGVMLQMLKVNAVHH